MLRSGGFYRWLSITVLILPAHLAKAQNENFWHRGGNGIWVGIQNKHPFSKQWLLQSDLQLRFRNNSSIYDYTLLRSGLYYIIKKDWLLGAGVVYGRNDLSHKKKPVWEDEFRLFQDARWNIPTTTSWKPGLQLRLEERWFYNAGYGQFNEKTFATRLRIRADLRKEFGKKWRLLAGNELMYQRLHNNFHFNQNRVWVGSGYQIHKMEFQVLLMQMIVDTRDQSIIRLNAIF